MPRILQKAPLYDGYDPRHRRQVDAETLRDLPLLNDDGSEHNIYDADGYRVPRQATRSRADATSCGMLVDLRQVRPLFQHTALDRRALNGAEDDDFDAGDYDDQVEAKIGVYPQAYLKHLGHFQANAVPSGFAPLLSHINRTLAANADEDNPVIQGVSCQMYNHAQHSLTERAGGLDIVRGKVTAALAGITQGLDARTKRKADKALEDVSEQLPIDDVVGKLTGNDGAGIGRALRAEPSFSIAVEEIMDERRCGGQVPLSNHLHVNLIEFTGQYTPRLSVR
jgi:hypothetical protein